MLYWYDSHLNSNLFFFQGSRDNMSIVIVTCPGAPGVSTEAIKHEEELDQLLETKVKGAQFIS